MHFIVSLLALLLIIAHVFNIDIKTLLIIIGLFIGGIFLIHKIGATAFFTIIGIILLILLLWFLWAIRVEKKNLKRPLINKKYGRCKNCMSPDIFLLKKENIIRGYQHQKRDGTRDYRYKDNQAFYRTVFYYKCNDCSLEFTNHERE